MANATPQNQIPLPSTNKETVWPEGSSSGEAGQALADAYQAATGHLPEEGCELEKTRVYEDLKLQQNYAGKYVAYRDHVDIIPGGSRKLWREVIFSHESPNEVQKVVAVHPCSESILIDFMDEGEREPLASEVDE